MIGIVWSTADNSGKQTRRSGQVVSHRRSPQKRPSSTLKATVRLLEARVAYHISTDPDEQYEVPSPARAEG
jgi:hypothetical protein